MITTIKLHKRTKSFLDNLKSNNETYDAVINKILLQQRKSKLKQELIECYTKNEGFEEFLEWDRIEL